MRFLLVLLAATSVASAVIVDVPEIDANSAATAITLVAGGLLVLRGRRRR